MTKENSNILIVNGGSSSIKFAIFDLGEMGDKIVSGQINKIGSKHPVFSYANFNDEKDKIEIGSKDFTEAAGYLIDWLKKQKYFDKIVCIGHRIVHGMEHNHPEVINEKLLNELKKITEYDPDHLPLEIELIRLFQIHYPMLLQVACFDTSFHTTMPPVAKILPIPRRFYNAGIRRYGFHGLSYAYLMGALKNVGGSDESKGRIILAHLGNGASLVAVKDGKSIDTTMGFTPAGGLVMGSRPGDLDPGIAWYMMRSGQITADEFNHLINQESGLLGVSEISSDMQDLLQKEASDVRAADAITLFCYQVKKCVGAFAAVLNGLDTMVFSGGIGENAPVIRSRICEGLNYLGVELDEDQNNLNGSVISKANSKIKVFVIPTDEESMIAKVTRELYLNAQNKSQ